MDQLHKNQYHHYHQHLKALELHLHQLLLLHHLHLQLCLKNQKNQLLHHYLEVELLEECFLFLLVLVYNLDYKNHHLHLNLHYFL